MTKIKKTISILLICVMIVGGLCSCTSISTLIEESKTIYADGEIVYVKSIPESGVHYVIHTSQRSQCDFDFIIRSYIAR